MKVYENYVKQECASKRRKVDHDSKKHVFVIWCWNRQLLEICNMIAVIYVTSYMPDKKSSLDCANHSPHLTMAITTIKFKAIFLSPKETYFPVGLLDILVLLKTSLMMVTICTV